MKSHYFYYVLIFLGSTVLEAAATQDFPIAPSGALSRSPMQTIATPILRSQGPHIAFPTSIQPMQGTVTGAQTSYASPYEMQNAKAQQALCMSQLLRSMTLLVQEITGVLQRIECVPGNTNVIPPSLPMTNGSNAGGKSGIPGEVTARTASGAAFNGIEALDGLWHRIIREMSAEEYKVFASHYPPPYSWLNSSPGNIYNLNHLDGLPTLPPQLLAIIKQNPLVATDGKSWYWVGMQGYAAYGQISRTATGQEFLWALDQRFHQVVGPASPEERANLLGSGRSLAAGALINIHPGGTEVSGRVDYIMAKGYNGSWWRVSQQGFTP